MRHRGPAGRALAASVVAGVLLSTLVNVRPAHACRCAPPAPEEWSLSAIVVATAVEEMDKGPGPAERWLMIVDSVARGDLAPGNLVEVRVHAEDSPSAGGSACTISAEPPAIGGVYVVAGKLEGDELHVNSCTGGALAPVGGGLLGGLPGGGPQAGWMFASPGTGSGPVAPVQPDDIEIGPGSPPVLVSGGGSDASHGVLTAAGVALIAAAAGTAMLASARLGRRRPGEAVS